MVQVTNDGSSKKGQSRCQEQTYERWLRDRLGRNWSLLKLRKMKEESWMTQISHLVEPEYIKGHIQFWTC